MAVDGKVDLGRPQITDAINKHKDKLECLYSLYSRSRSNWTICWKLL